MGLAELSSNSCILKLDNVKFKILYIAMRFLWGRVGDDVEEGKTIYRIPFDVIWRGKSTPER